MEKYNYVMRYVPVRSDLEELHIPEIKHTEKECDDVQQVISAAMSAVEAMNAMCAMVYMKCMEKLAEKI